MKRVIVRYKLKPECVGENEALVRAVYEELHRTKPPGVRYATFRADDGVTFFHFASIETKDDSNPLASLAAFKAFLKDINARCDEPPLPVNLREIGVYAFFAE